MRLADGRVLRNLGLGAACCLMVGTGWSDDFYLKSGKTVRGALVSETETEYVLHTEMGTIKLKKADVSRHVSAGTTEAEIAGDTAAAKGDLQSALNFYAQAVTAVTDDPVARERIQGKINQVNSYQSRAAAGATTAQFQQARQLLDSRQYESAETLLNRLVSQVSPADPLTSEIKKMQAQIYYGKGVTARDMAKFEVARVEFQRALDADPSYYPAYLAMGEGLLGKSSSAREGTALIEKGLQIGGDRIQEQQRYNYEYMLARKYYDLGDFSNAASAYASLIPVKDKYPTYADSLDKAVDSYVKMGEENLTSNFQETISNLNLALKLNPENPKALFLLGRIYLDLGQVENSVVTLKNLISLDDDYEEANHYLGKAYFQMKEYGLAMQHLSAEVTSHPNNYRALVDRAEVQIAMGNFTGADADLKAARVLDDKNWYSYYLGGLLAFTQEDYARARTELTSALDRNRSAVPVHLLMGRVLMQQKENDGARQWFDQVAKSLGDSKDLNYRSRMYRAEALTYMGQMAVAENSPRQAIHVLKEALQSVPDYGPALIALADADLIMANDAAAEKSRPEYYDEAEKLYQTAVKKDPNNPEVYLKLATFYHKYKVNQEQARANYNLYVDKGGRDGRVNGWLVEVGGAARPEIAPPPPVSTAALTTTSTTGTTATATTTGTATLTTGTAALPANAPPSGTTPAPGTAGLPGTATVAPGTATSVSTPTLEAANMAAPAIPGAPAIPVEPVPTPPQ